MDATVEVRAGGLVDVVAAPVNDVERDAAPRINAAFQEGALLGTGGVELHLPPGTFWVKSTVVIPTGCTLMGSGPGTVLKAVAGLNADVIANEASSTGVQIRDLKVDGNRANQTGGNGINLTGADDCVVENVQIVSCYGEGLVLSGQSRSRISGVTTTDCGGNGIRLTTAVRAVLADVHAYDNCRVADPDTADGIRLDTTSTDNVIVGADCTDSRTAQEAAPAAPTAALAGAGAGSVDNGAHQYQVTLVTQWGESSAGTASGAVTVLDKTTNGQVALSGIPTGTNGVCTARKIYRTKAGGATYYLLATISDNTGTTYTDNTADASLGAAAPTLNTSGKRQGYGVREAAASSCDRNVIVGGSLAGNSTGTTSLVGSSSSAGPMTNPMSAVGDLIVGGASGTPSRLPMGPAKQNVRVNAGGTALEFAKTLLTDLDPTGLTASQFLRVNAGGTAPETVLIPIDALAPGSANLKAFVKGDASKVEWSDGIKIGSFTKNTADASVSWSYTGIGFRPRAVIFLAVVSAAVGEASVGFDDSFNRFGLLNYYNYTAHAWAYDPGYSIYLLQGSGITCQGQIVTMDVDGFTINWVKYGSPTGTANIGYLAFR